MVSKSKTFKKLHGVLDRTVYYIGDIVHRTNGPAIYWEDGDYVWYINDTRHRYYGPQSSQKEWWLHGRLIKSEC